MPAQQSANPQCPFCQLAANPDQTFDVHETEHFKAWLDINPRARGHTMVVPKEHWTSMEEIGEHVPELFEIIRIVMEKARNGLDADGVSVVLNDGEAAGQRLDHFYAQVFPRFDGEENEGAPAGAVFQPLEDLDESDLEEFSGKMEGANFSSDGNTVEGAASGMVQRNRTERHNAKQQQEEQGTDSKIVDRDELSTEEDDSTEEDTDDDDEEEDKEKKKKRHRRGSSWDGDSYSWDSDGAEFQ